MRYKLLSLGLIASLCCALIWPCMARAADDEPEADYYTLQNEERYTLIHEVKVNNFGVEPANNISLSLPLMDNETPAYSRKLREQIVPWPDRIETDDRGRRTAYYYLDEIPAGEEMVFTQKYVVDLAGISYNKSIVAASGGYSDQLASLYLLPSPNIESDNPEIIAFAKRAAGGKNNIYDIAHEAFAVVNLHMSYVNDDLVYGGALRALRRAQGVCEDYSSLYVAVLRAMGIAARQQGGYLYLPGEHNQPPYLDEAQQRLNLNQLRHTWVEFYVPGDGWVIADPTFTYSFELSGGVPTKFVNWDYFASIPDGRRYLAFYEGSVNEDRGEMHTGGNESVNHSFDGYLLFGSQAAYYNDLPGHWAEEAIMRLSDREQPLLQGMGNGLFGVNEPMTRAQLVACLQRLLKSPPAGPKFTDLRTTHWAYRDIGSAQQAGWIKGYPDGSFRPDTAVSRAEMASILVDVFKLQLPEEEPQQEDMADGELANNETTEPEPTEDKLTENEDDILDEPEEAAKKDSLPFEDLGLPGYAWADNAIITLAKLGLSQGNGEGHYQPQRPVTRAEFAAFFDRIITLQQLEQLPGQ